MTEHLTAAQLEEKLRGLEAQLGMTVVHAENLASVDALDADLYQVLRRIRDLRWLQTP